MKFCHDRIFERVPTLLRNHSWRNCTAYKIDKIYFKFKVIIVRLYKEQVNIVRQRCEYNIGISYVDTKCVLINDDKN